MKHPPLGYDDETIMPSIQAKHCLHQLMQKLSDLEKKPLFFPSEILDEIASIFEALLQSTEELPSGHHILAEDLFKNYQQFIKEPSEKGLKKMKEKLMEVTNFLQV